jgi:hypothetical protein
MVVTTVPPRVARRGTGPEQPARYGNDMNQKRE